jgi:hypothetical protein
MSDKIKITDSQGNTVTLTHGELLSCLKKQDIDPSNVLINSLRRFAVDVRDMRNAQAAYFKGKQASDLSMAKGLEKKIDGYLPNIFILLTKV